MKSANPYYPFHPGIQIAAIPVKHSVGLFISIATIVICLLGLSFTFYYLGAALVAGVVFCWTMRRYRRSHPPRMPLSLGLE